MLFHYGSLLDQLRALESSKNVKLIKKISAKVSSQDTVERSKFCFSSPCIPRFLVRTIIDVHVRIGGFYEN